MKFSGFLGGAIILSQSARWQLRADTGEVRFRSSFAHRRAERFRSDLSMRPERATLEGVKPSRIGVLRQSLTIALSVYVGRILVAPPPIENLSPPCVPPPCVASASSRPAAEAVRVDPPNQEESWLDGIAGFLVSGTIHLALLLILALLARTDKSSGPIVMSLASAEAVEPVDLQTLEWTSLETLPPGQSPAELVKLEGDPLTETTELDLAMSDLQVRGESQPAGIDVAVPAPAAAKPNEPRQSVSFFGTHAYGDKFVYVLDVSGSMSARNGARMMRAQSELLRSIQQLKPHHSFYVVLYNTGAIKMFGEAGEPRLRPATRENKQLAARWISSFRPTGGTFPGEALKIAGDLHPDAVFFLSDGDFIYSGGPGMESPVNQFLNGFAQARASALRGAMPRLFPQVALDAYEPDIVVHTIALESESSRRKMELIAAMKDGEHRFIPAGGR